MAKKTCEQCGGEYEKGFGVTEDDTFGLYQLPERFCGDACAEEYEHQISEAIDPREA